MCIMDVRPVSACTTYVCLCEPPLSFLRTSASFATRAYARRCAHVGEEHPPRAYSPSDRTDYMNGQYHKKKLHIFSI